MENLIVTTVVFFILLILAAALRYRRRPEWKGQYAESLVARWLMRGLDSKVYPVLNDFLIPDGAGGTTQIDHLVLSPFGLFVVETKERSGWIFGDAKAAQWMQVLFCERHRFQNPFRQNYKHIQCLSALTGVSPELFISVVVFTGNFQIKTPDQLPESLIISKRGLFRFIFSFSETRISPQRLEYIRNKILAGRIENTLEAKEKHIAYIQGLLDGKRNGDIPPHCPRCGAFMVRRRTGGWNAGRFFWSCPNYPHDKSGRGE